MSLLRGQKLLMKDEQMKTFNHAFDFAFDVISNKKDASDVTPNMLRDACIKRINSICDEEILEACGIFDTMENIK